MSKTITYLLLLLTVGLLSQLILFAFFDHSSTTNSQESKINIIISNAHYLKDSQITKKPYYIGISGNKISYIDSRAPRGKADLIIDATGLIVSPGFIDTNTVGYATGEVGIAKAFDGVTTTLIAHGGGVGESLESYNARSLLNYATTIGLAGVGFSTAADESRLLEALTLGLHKGAYGISLSPEYDRRITKELIDFICLNFKNQPIAFSFHTRYSDAAREHLGIDEAISCAEYVHGVHILHINSSGGTYGPEKAVNKIHRNRDRGKNIIYDFYPYTAWLSGIMQNRFRGDWQSRYQIDFSNLRRPKRTNALSKNEFNALKHSGINHKIIVDSIPQSTIDYLALNTSAPIGSESSVIGHPRAVASFTKFLKTYALVSEDKFAQALFRFSTAPAQWFSDYIPGLKKRGSIRVGFYADLVLWDKDLISDHATFDSPKNFSTGVHTNIINGEPIILHRKFVSPKKPSGIWLKGALTKGNLEPKQTF